MSKHKLKLSILMLCMAIFLAGCDSEEDIKNFYKEAGFKGDINVTEALPDGGLKSATSYTYIYEETVSDKKISAEAIVNSTDDDLYYAENFDTPEELAQNHMSQLVSPLFAAAFEATPEFQNIEGHIKKSIAQVGLVSRDINLDYNLAVDEKFIASELTKDLKKTSSDAPFKGLTTLDFNKYFGFGMYSVKVYLDKPIPDFKVNSLNLPNLPDATYDFYVFEKGWRKIAGEREEYDVPRTYFTLEVKNGKVNVTYDFTDKYNK